MTTGISASSRARHEQKRNAVKSVIKEIQKESIRWAEAFRQFNEQSDEKLSEFEFNSILRDLSDEGFIAISGRTNADRLLQKLKSQF